MIAILTGTLVTAKMKQPNPGQEFKAHQAIGLLQIEDGEPDLVKLKDMDLSRQHKANSSVKLKCSINHWDNGNMSGNAIKVIDVL